MRAEVLADKLEDAKERGRREATWNTRPYALIFDAGRWTQVAAVPAPGFRGWRYLETPPEGGIAPAGEPPDQPCGGAGK